MYILAIETTGPLGSVALINDEKEIICRTSTEEMNHLKGLMPMAEEIIKEAGISKTDITAVAASAGPGSFTGIRIGVATARAISQALNIPAIKVPTLEIFKEFCDGTRPVAVIFNARRGQVYGAIFGPEKETIMKPGPYMLDDVLKVVADNNLKPVFYGDGADAYADQVEAFDKASKETRYQRADVVAAVAFDKMNAGETCTFGDLLPDYMREVEANQKLRSGQLAKERAAKLERLRNS